MSVREKLTEAVADLEVISTHEHHQVDAFFREMSLEKILENSYVSWCGVPCGTSEAEHRRFLDQVRHNTYYVWLEKSLRELYGFEGSICAENWESISRRITETHGKNPDRHLEILRRRCRYSAAVQDSTDDPGSDRGHPDLFKPTYRINMFLYGYHPEAADHNGNNPLVKYAERPSTFAEYLEFVEGCVTRARIGGCVALKSALAYDRSVSVGEPRRSEAERAWGRHPEEVSETEKTAFGDYVFNHLMKVAWKLEMPVQVHLGLARLRDSDPVKFIPVLERHRRVSFDLFHGGYPWTSVMGGIGHQYHSAWLDVCWLPLISTNAAIRALSEWLDTSTSCERIVWGGDAWTSEESYGALLAMRAVLVEVLASRIERELTDFDGACELAGQILQDNALALFRL